MKIVVALSGATGSIYGIRLLQELKKTEQVETHLIISRWAAKTIQLETDFTLEYIYSLADVVYSYENVGAKLASGSFMHDGMVIIPCSMKTLSAIANGFSEDLISRAADVSIKERRKLILVTRETPLSPIHLDNMLKLARVGVTIMPPMPSFYTKPITVNDIVNQFVGRIMDTFSIENAICKHWEGSE